MAIVLHITTHAEWDTARATGSYRAPSLDHEGFVHCSTPSQAAGSANRYFRGRCDLVLLCIDESRLTAALRYEPPAVSGAAADPRTELFPHLYGPLNLDAVVGVVAFPCDADGAFALPALPAVQPDDSASTS